MPKLERGDIEERRDIEDRADGAYVEIGTSAGYCTLWLALAYRGTRRAASPRSRCCPPRQPSHERLSARPESRTSSDSSKGTSCTLPKTWTRFASDSSMPRRSPTRAVTTPSYPRLVTGGILFADNAVNHRQTLQPMLDTALTDERVVALIVPISKGELFCRKR